MNEKQKRVPKTLWSTIRNDPFAKLSLSVLAILTWLGVFITLAVVTSAGFSGSLFVITLVVAFLMFIALDLIV